MLSAHLGFKKLASSVYALTPDTMVLETGSKDCVLRQCCLFVLRWLDPDRIVNCKKKTISIPHLVSR